MKIKKRHTLGYTCCNVFSFPFFVPSAEIFLRKDKTDYQLLLFFMCQICVRNIKFIKYFRDFID